MKFLCAISFAIIASVACVTCETIPSDDQVISMINNLDEETSLPLFGGLSLEKVESSGIVDESRGAESLTDRLIRYIRTHKVNFDLSESRSGDAGEAKGKLKKLALPLLLALKFKSAVILPVVFTILTLVSLKALKVGLIALLLAGSSFVKELFAKKQEKVTTAYIQPSNSGFNAEIVTDWNRNGAAPADLAYNGYQAPNYQTLPQNI